MERKLVSLQVIDSLTPIAGADNIVAARVMGWTVVVKKGEFSPGDPCVFFEIDSVLPDGPAWAEFMRPRGFRVRSVKLRGVLSQGLALPLRVVEETLRGDAGGLVGEVDVRALSPADLRVRLGVTKYEAVLPDEREFAGPFPGEVPKTDEIRLQSALGVLDELRGRPFYVTTKCDGTSATFLRDDEGLRVCSRNWTLARGDNPLWRLADAYRFEERLPRHFAVQGEVCGPRIQKNPMALDETALFVFSVFDVRAGRFLDYDAFIAFCVDHDLPTVPVERVVSGAEAATFPHSLAYWLEAARGRYAGSKHHKEGIVVRPLVEASSAVLGGRLSFKVINDDFLLATGG